MNKLTSLAVAAVAALSLFADTHEFSMWRGETTAIIVPDYVEFDEPPAGIDIKFGVLKPIKYIARAHTLQRAECFDRVEWNSKKVDGPRVAEIHVPADAKPGVYACGLLKVHVIDRVMPPPSEWKYYLDLWQHPWAVARVAGVKPFTRAHYDAMRPVWELLATAGQKTLTVTLVDRPWNHQCRDGYGSMIGRTRMDDGSWKFDYSLFDEYVEFGRSTGLGPNIACYTMCPWGYRVKFRNSKGETVTWKAKPGTGEFEDFWGDFLQDFAHHLKAKGWFENASIAMDERSPEDVKIIADFIQRKAPGMKISLAGNRRPSEFKGVKIDNYSQYLGFITPEFIAEEIPERRKNGYVTTFYVCCSPEAPNTFLFNHPDESFWIGVYPALAGMDGFLRWAWNSWGEDPMHDGSFREWNAGDAYLAYPDGSPSMRFLNLRNGIVAAEKLRILSADPAFAADIAKLRSRFDYREAKAKKADFRRLRLDTEKLVNRR